MFAAEDVQSYYSVPRNGEVPERSIGAVSKTVVPFSGTEGSNPSLSAN
jgi:hypothetical protein